MCAIIYETKHQDKKKTSLKSDFRKGVCGFKNGAPAYANNAFSDVDLFLHTWGFLPNDNSILEKLTKEQLLELCQYALGASCRIDLRGDGIKAVQKLMNSFGISPNKIET